jgi:hypothetical protein
VNKHWAEIDRVLGRIPGLDPNEARP